MEFNFPHLRKNSALHLCLWSCHQDKSLQPTVGLIKIHFFYKTFFFSPSSFILFFFFYYFILLLLLFRVEGWKVEGKCHQWLGSTPRPPEVPTNDSCRRIFNDLTWQRRWEISQHLCLSSWFLFNFFFFFWVLGF